MWPDCFTGLLSCGRYLAAPVTGDKEGGAELASLRVRPTLNRFLIIPVVGGCPPSISWLPKFVHQVYAFC